MQATITRQRFALTRREILRGSLALVSLGLLSGCATLPFGPQRQARLPRVGYLSGSGAPDRADGFRLGLADHGYVEGQNIVVEWRDAEGRADRVPGLAAELVGIPVDVLVADGTDAIQPVKAATDTIPIVMGMSTGPVEDGFIASLARPGGNVTGLSSGSRELIRKRLELFTEVVPGIARVGVLWNPAIARRVGEFQVAEEAARALGLELRSLEARDHGDLEAAFASAERMDGLFLLDNPGLTTNASRVGALARLHRLPMNSAIRPLVAAGGLLAYGADRPALYRRAAGYVDRILKGANPAEMPVELPTTFELLINIGTAQALGLTIPQSVLTQATELIQ